MSYQQLEMGPRFKVLSERIDPSPGMDLVVQRVIHDT